MAGSLASSWSRAWSALGCLGNGSAVRDALLARYSEPHRRYHTLQHLEECLSHFERAQHLALRPHEIAMALWFHDAIYELRASDNEDKSAAWAQDALNTAGADRDACNRIRDLVLATKHKEIPVEQDAQVVVDIDLSILGANPERFAQYEEQIREEYSYVPNLLFRTKRRSILRAFLDRGHVYNTTFFRELFEAQARINLTRATD